VIISLAFETNAIFSAENRRKSPKIVIITSASRSGFEFAVKRGFFEFAKNQFQLFSRINFPRWTVFRKKKKSFFPLFSPFSLCQDVHVGDFAGDLNAKLLSIFFTMIIFTLSTSHFFGSHSLSKRYFFLSRSITSLQLKFSTSFSLPGEDETLLPVRPDLSVKKIAQNVALPIFFKNDK
jgi:hypothetical protein